MTGRMARAGAVVLIFAVGLVLAGRAPGAWACSCAGGGTRADSFEQAEVVFSGVVTSKDDPHGDDEVVSGGRLISYTFNVRAEQKGDVADPAVVKSEADGAACGYGFKVGRRYQVYGEQRANGTVRTGLCSGTERLSEGEAPYVLAALPTTGIDTPAPLAAGVTLLGVAAALAMKRRRAAD